MSYLEKFLPKAETETPAAAKPSSGSIVERFLPKSEAAPAAPQGPYLEDQARQVEQEAYENSRPAGGGMAGLAGDVARGAASGVMRGMGGLARAVQWVAPDQTPLDEVAKRAAGWTDERLARNADLFAESQASAEGRESSPWNVRGWLYPGLESLGMMAPGVATTVVTGNPVAGAAVTGAQFWGDTAQQSYDQSEGLSESEKVAHANWKGAAEGGTEALLSFIPFKIAQALPRALQGKLIAKAAGASGKAPLEIGKDIVKTIAAEVPVEMGQEYLGQSADYAYEQRPNMPGFSDVAPVIGPTIIMAGLLGTGAAIQANGQRRAIHDALTNPAAPVEVRLRAVDLVEQELRSRDGELADLWQRMAGEQAQQGPVAIDLIQGAADGKQPSAQETAEVAAPAPAAAPVTKPAPAAQPVAGRTLTPAPAAVAAPAAVPQRFINLEAAGQQAAAPAGALQRAVTVAGAAVRNDAMAVPAAVPDLQPGMAQGGVDGGLSEVRQEAGVAAEVPPVRGANVGSVPAVRVKDAAPGSITFEVDGREVTLRHGPGQTREEFTAAVRGVAGLPISQAFQQLSAQFSAVDGEQGQGPLPTPLDAQAHEAASSPENERPEPTPAQIEAGNYKKGHVKLHGLDISIENPAGSVRKGVDETGRAMETGLTQHYGYIRGSVGKDGDHVDVFVKPGIDEATAGDAVFVVDQKNVKTGKFDESKVLIGYGSEDEARAAYLSNYDETGPQRIMNLSATTAGDFRQWLQQGNTKRPFAKATPAKVETTAAVGPIPDYLHKAIQYDVKSIADLRPGHVAGILDTWEGPAARRIADGLKQYRPDLAEAVDKAMAERHPDGAEDHVAEGGKKVEPAAAPVAVAPTPAKLKHPLLQRQALAQGVKISKKQPDGSYVVTGKDGGEFRAGSLAEVADHLAGAGKGIDQVPDAGKMVAAGAGSVAEEAVTVKESLTVETQKRVGTETRTDTSGVSRADDTARRTTDPDITIAGAGGDVKTETVKPAAEKKPESGNTVFTEDAYQKARAVMKAKLSQLNAGIDPELMQAGFTIAGYHIEKGSRQFVNYAAAMIEDFGEAIKPYLKAFYNGVRDLPGIDQITGEMDSYQVVAGYAVETMDSSGESDIIVNEEENTPKIQEESDGKSAGVGAESPEALGGASAGADQGAEGGGSVRGGKSGRGKTDQGRNGRSANAGVSRARSRRGGAAAVHPAETGALTLAPAEAPGNLPAVNFAITDEVKLGQGSEGVKFADNLAAIRTLKEIERENRRATAEEQRLLARYVGWGGLSNAFADDRGAFKPGWEARGQELAELLTAAELKAARRSTRNAHYTSEAIVRGMWQAVRAMGFARGMVLEPSAGSGNFLGLAPADLAARFVAVEYDSLTARMAGALYPQSTVLHSGFQKLALPDNAFDLAIGNPPFGAESLQFQHKPHLNRHSIHNQFFLGSLEALKPGGLQAMVVSRYLLDAKDSGARLELAAQAKLQGAVRLPDTAFKENARTEVVTDILFLQKLSAEEQEQMDQIMEAYRSGPKKAAKEEAERRALAAQVPNWVQTTTVPDPLGGEAMTVNSYFARHPEMIIGTLERSGSMRHGADITVRLEKGADFEAELERRLELLPKAVMPAPTALEAIEQRHQELSDSLRIALEGLEHGSIVFDKDGRLSEVIERETPEGGYEFAKRELSPTAPWSDRLIMGADGRWYTLDDALDEQGNKVKQLDAKGKATRLNAKVRNVFESEAHIPDSMRLGASRFERLVELIKLRDLLKKQLVLETSDAPKAEMERNRSKLNALYDAFVAQHDFLNSPKNEGLISDMPDGALIVALELGYRPALSAAKAKQMGEAARPADAQKAPILTERVVIPYEPPSKAASAADALVISMAESGRVDLERLAALLGTDQAGVVAALHEEPQTPLIFHDPELNAWQSRDQYLSGQVKRKLAAARGANLEKNVVALEQVQPEPWSADQVTAVMGATWIPTDVYEGFIEHLTGEKGRVSFSRVTNAFDLRVPNTAKGKDWQTEDADLDYLLKQMLNSQSIRLTYKDGEGKTHFMPEATALAQVKADQIAVEFGDWVFAEGDRRRRLVEIFNEKFNVRVQRQYDGQHLFLPGKVPDQIIQMRRHQKNAIWRGIQERYLLLDHVVGAGKTFTAIARAIERRRMGLSRKPMIVVPNHMVGQFAADVYRLYPGAKLLAAGKKDFDSKNRRRLFAKIATGDWDLVIVPHSSFKFISISPEAEERYLEEEIRIAKEAIKEAEEEAAEQGLTSGWRKPFNVKQAEALAEKLENKLAKLKGKSADRLLTFEQLGVDDMTIDEAHEFKNLFYSSRMTGVRGMGDRAGSEKAYDLYQKVRVLRDSPTGSVVFMTGTPISNSAVEMYTMMRYLAGDELRDLGLEHFDAWRAQYVEAATAWEPTESGRLKEVTRLGRSWSNMRSLMDLYYSFTDAVPLDDIKTWYAEDNAGRPFPVPRVKGGERTKVVVPPTPAQTEQLTEILAGFDGLEGIKDPNQRNAARLRLMDRARKVSLDARAVDPSLPTREAGGKLEAVSREVKRLYDRWAADKGTQLVFLDRSVPKSKGDDKLLKDFDKAVAERDEALARGDERGYMAAVEKLERFDENEVAELRRAQAGGWNAYQQIKENLVALGIPAKEIRFVQEASTDEQKQALFDAVNAGEVRVFLGSTPRMGAGTNVQQRLVGLHHVDVTWKPSDIEQREGRIIRQGNRLLEQYGIDKFEVEVLAYATERTVDAKMWDLNATKLRTINGIRKYSGEFTMDFEDEESVGMAEIAALASGDPLLLERVKLDSEINRLEILRRGYNRQVMALRDRVDDTEKEIRTLPAVIERRKAAAQMLAAAKDEVITRAAHRSLSVEGKDYYGQFAAHQAIESVVKAQQGGDEKARFAVEVGGEKLTSKAAIERALETLGDSTPFEMMLEGEVLVGRSPAARVLTKRANELVGQMLDAGSDSKTARLGEYLGYGLDLDVETSWGGSVRATLSLVDGRGSSVETVTGSASEVKKGERPGLSPQNIRKLLDNFVETVNQAASKGAYRTPERKLEAAEKALPELKKQLEAKGEFPQQQELKQKRERLVEVVEILAAKQPAKAEEPGAADEGVKHSVASRTVLLGDSGLGKVEVAAARALPFIQRMLEKEALEQVYVKGGNVEALREVGKLFGKTLVFFRERRAAGDGAERAGDAAALRHEQSAGDPARARMAVGGDPAQAGRVGIVGGFVHPSRPDLVYLNVEAPEHLLRLTGHELGHTLRMEDPELWRQMAAELRPMIRNWGAYRQTLSDAHYASLTEEEQFEELVGDVIGENFLNPAFWEQMAQTSESLFKRIAKKAVGLLTRALRVISGKPGVERYVADMTQARAIVAKTLVRYGEKAQGGLYRRYADTFDASALEQRIDGAALLAKLNEMGISNEVLRKAFEGTRFGVEVKESGEEDVKFSVAQAARDKTAAGREFVKKLTPDKNGLPYAILSGKILPDRMKAAIGSVLSNPHYGSRKSKFRTAAYDLALERGANANEIKHEIMASEGDYAGLEGVREGYRRASKDERAMVDKLLVEGDIEQREYGEKDLAGEGNPLGQVVPERVRQVYLAFRQTINKATEVLFDRLGRLRLIPYENSPFFDELVELLDKGLTPADVAKRFGIEQKAVDAYLQIRQSRVKLDAATAPYREQPWYSNLRESLQRGMTMVEMQQTFAKSPELLDAFRTVRKDHQGEFATAEKFKAAAWYKTLVDLLTVGDDHPMLQKLELYNAYQGVHEYDSQLAKLKDQWRKAKGYLPRLRQDGEQHVKVFKVEEGGTFTEVWMRPAKTEYGAGQLRDAVAANLKEYLPHSFDPEARYEVVVEPNRATPEEIFLGIGSHRAIEGLLSKVFDKATDAGIIENQLAVQQQVLRILADEISTRGFGRHRLSRAEHLIEGYETSNTPSILAQFTGSMAGWLSKSEFAMRSNKLMSQIPADRAQDKVWVREYVDDALKNSTYIDQWFGTARSFAALMYLGFKASSAVLNATQNYIWGQAKLSSYTSGATIKLLRAQRDVVQERLLAKAGKPGNLNEEEAWVLEEGLRRGRSQAQFVRAMSGMDDTGGVLGKGQAGLRWLTDKAMVPFQLVETHWNREPALLAAYRVFRSEKGMEREAALKAAERFVDDVHFVVGKENIPALLRKMGPLGRTLYTFQSYTHNYLLGMLTSLSKGEFQVVVRSLTALVLFGGLAALPFGDDLDKWYRRIFGERPLRMLDKWLRETAGEYVDFGDQVADFVLHGAPALGGVNFSNAIGVNIPWFSPEDESLAERVVGVWGGMMKKIQFSSMAAARGDGYRAVEFMAPEALANILRAYRLYADGTTTLSGRPVFGDDGKQVRYTAKEALVRSFGFMPLEPSKQTQARWDAQRARDYWSERKGDVLARVRIATDRKAALAEIQAFNRALRAAPGGVLVPPITLASLRQAMRAKADKRELAYRNQ